MKAFGMKSLSLAVLGLVGFGMASSASATCPFPFNTPTGAWSAQGANGGTLAAASPGLELSNPSACKMTAYINATGTGPLATAAVLDFSPTNEASYHFRFYIDTTNLASMPNLTSVQIFAANSAVNFPLTGNNQTLALMRLGIAGVGAVSPKLVAVSACNVGPGYRCVGSVNLTPGVHWIEGHITFGAAAITNIWVDKASITNDTTPAPDISLAAFDNSEWGGVDTVALGLGGTSPSFRANFSGPSHVVGFDNFDSRRQTFIGQ